MKTTASLVAILAITAACPAVHGLPSTIRQVDLYPAGASVTRAVAVPAGAGPAITVEIGDLPGTILPASFQIAAVDAPGLRIGGFTYLPQENPVRDDDPRTADLRAVVERIDEDLRVVRLERETIQQRISHFNGVAESIRKSLGETASTDAFELARAAWEAAEKVRLEGENRMAALAVDARRFGIERQKAQEDLDKLLDGLRRRTGVLRFDLAGDLARGASLLVRYQVQEAGWSPVHEIRALPAQGSVEWIYKARIWQQSGEDWDSAKVTLNSASALYAGGLPELPPLYLEHAEIRPMARAKMESLYDVAMMAAPAAAMEQGAVPQSTTTGFFIHLPEPLSLKSDNQPVVREAFTGRLAADFWSEAAPELSTEAWLMAGITNELGWPILAGESYAYIDGQLVARRFIGEIAAGEEVDLDLGRNEKIAIERKERVKKESEGGLIDRTKRHEIKYETTVENRMQVAHKVVLQDRFPVGRDNKIQVRISSPKDVKPEEGTGLFKWEKTLQPGEKGVLITEYSVLYPADWTIHPPL